MPSYIILQELLHLKRTVLLPCNSTHQCLPFYKRRSFNVHKHPNWCHQKNQATILALDWLWLLPRSLTSTFLKGTSECRNFLSKSLESCLAGRQVQENTNGVFLTLCLQLFSKLVANTFWIHRIRKLFPLSRITIAPKSVWISSRQPTTFPPTWGTSFQFIFLINWTGLTHHHFYD